MKMKFDTLDEMESYASTLADEKKWVIDTYKAPDGTFELQWIESKNYTAWDGKEFPDESWVTKEGELILVQDMTPEHVRNVLRMILRQDREFQSAVGDMTSQLMNAIAEMADTDLQTTDLNQVRVLH